MANIARNAYRCKPAGDYHGFPAVVGIAQVGAGQPVYIAGAQPERSGGLPIVQPADANAPGLAGARGLASVTAAPNQAITVITDGPFAGFSGLTPGQDIYLSDTWGELADAPGATEVVIGWALNEETIMVSIKP